MIPILEDILHELGDNNITIHVDIIGKANPYTPVQLEFASGDDRDCDYLAEYDESDES